MTAWWCSTARRAWAKSSFFADWAEVVQRQSDHRRHEGQGRAGKAAGLTWILELGELAGLKKVDVETVKAFITRQDEQVPPLLRLQRGGPSAAVIIVGSTNNGDGFLRTSRATAAWPVTCTTAGKHRPWEVADVVEQTLGGGVCCFSTGRRCTTPEVERLAEAEQTEALESDVREGMIAEYLEKLLPEDWDRMDLSERRGFLRGDLFTGGSRVGTARRTVVSAVEIWAECFGKEPTAIRRSDTYDIFGMLMKIGGWESTAGTRTVSCAGRHMARSDATSESQRNGPQAPRPEQRPFRA